VGARLLDDSLDPEEVLRGTLVPKLVSKRPERIPISVEWPDVFYKEPEQVFAFTINGVEVYRHDCDITLIDPAAIGLLKFVIAGASETAAFQLTLNGDDEAPDYAITATDGSGALIKYRGKTAPLRDFLEEEPPTFWFADGSSLTGVKYVKLPRQLEPFPRARIEPWTWAGTDIRTESQGIGRNPLSIQYRVISEMKNRQLSVIFDDDDAGESADIVGILEADERIEVEFWHCKFALDDKPGARIKELYEVCGQAQKSIRWLEKPRDLFTHLMRREPRHYKGEESTRYERGSVNDLLRIREKAESQRMPLRVFLVQPGLSMAQASTEQLELLAVTENYLLETFAVPLRVIASA